MIFPSIFGRTGTDAENGFTLIELLVTLVIVGIIAVAITMSVAQLFSGNARSNAHMAAVSNVENAVHWLTRDAQMSQNFTNDIPTSNFSAPGMTMTWSDTYDKPNTSGSVTYILNGTKLQRVYSENGDPATTTTIASHISSATWSFTGANVHTLHFDITSSVDASTIPAPTVESETRVFDVVPRSVP